jgi:hypothetical protein
MMCILTKIDQSKAYRQQKYDGRPISSPIESAKNGSLMKAVKKYLPSFMPVEEIKPRK